MHLYSRRVIFTGDLYDAFCINLDLEAEALPAGSQNTISVKICSGNLRLRAYIGICRKGKKAAMMLIRPPRKQFFLFVIDL